MRGKFRVSMGIEVYSGIGLRSTLPEILSQNNILTFEEEMSEWGQAFCAANISLLPPCGFQISKYPFNMFQSLGGTIPDFQQGFGEEFCWWYVVRPSPWEDHEDDISDFFEWFGRLGAMTHARPTSLGAIFILSMEYTKYCHLLFEDVARQVTENVVQDSCQLVDGS